MTSPAGEGRGSTKKPEYSGDGQQSKPPARNEHTAPSSAFSAALHSLVGVLAWSYRGRTTWQIHTY
jgi:hypothetical protein